MRFTQRIENCAFCGKCVFSDTQIAVSAFAHCVLRRAFFGLVEALFLGTLKDMRHGVVSGLFGTVMAVSPLLQTAKTTLQSGPVVSLQQTHTVLYQERHPGVTRFNSSYTYVYPSNNSVEELRIYGYEPTVGTGFPVYIHAGGFGDRFEDDVPEMRLAEEMARRGFVSVIIEMYAHVVRNDDAHTATIAMAHTTPIAMAPLLFLSARP